MKVPVLALVILGGAVVAGSAVPAFAENHDRTRDKVHGFVTYGTGEVSGRVTDEDGSAMAGADVHIVAGAAVEQVVKTDRDGKFKVTVGGGISSWVFVQGKARITGQAIVPSGGDGEIVEIHEAIPPAVMPKPRANPLAIPTYNDEAIEHNTWTRAWLLLDVDEAGKVQRLKLLKSPGFDLDEIAVRTGFKLRFDPALDRAQRPTSALVVWILEWPAYYWLLEQKDQLVSRVPEKAAIVPCRGTGPTHSIYRDCSRPDLTKAMSQPWFDRGIDRGIDRPAKN
jgi:hypothetical protein